MASAVTEKPDTRITLLEAAKQVLRSNGYAGLSTREVSLIARTPLSQIHYHFGSKQGLVLALFTHLNEQLLQRQETMFGNPDLRLSDQWRQACGYLDEDLASGYVRVLQELWAAGYSNPEIAGVVRDGILKWQTLLTGVARNAEERFGPIPHLTPEDLASLVGTAFIGAENYILLDMETSQTPVRDALRKIGDVISLLEANRTAGR